MSGCPCCPGTGIEVILRDGEPPNCYTILYWCISCVGGGMSTYSPGEKVPRRFPWPDPQTRLF